jgi:hypothetical protein
VRWNGLFEDLEAQAAELDRAERAGRVEDMARSELAQLGLQDRLRPAVGHPLRVRCLGGVTVTGVLSRVGSTWFLVDETGGREALIVMSTTISVAGLGRLSAAPHSGGSVESRLGLAHALRGIARDRSGVRLHLVDGTAVDGTVDRVGADFAELAVHAAGESRRRAEVREVLVVPVQALVAVRRDAQSAAVSALR